MRNVVCVLLVALAGLLVACAGAVNEKPKAKPKTREEMKTLLVGKTKSEVIELLGKPHRTHEERDGGGSFTYKNISHDPVADKTDLYMIVWFDADGKVERLAFG